MKKFYLLIISLFIFNFTYSQLDHDILLVKPLVNFNDTNGGYYSEYFLYNIDSVYCGAIVQNIGNLNATNVYLEINYLDLNNNITSTHYSDTIAILDTNQIDTIYSQHIFNLTSFWDFEFKISFKLISDSLDENEINNTDTLPSTILYESMWSAVSRSNIATDTFNISKVANFSSGDFIGATLMYSNGLTHQLAGIEVSMTGFWSDSLIMIGKVYQNGLLIDSAQINNFGGWAYGEFVNLTGIDSDSIYYFGVELHYPNGTNIPIGIDTSSFHNFSSETIARVNDVWTTLDFVPLVRLICDPEFVPELYNNGQLKIYPNPTSEKITIDNKLGITDYGLEVFDIYGKKVLKTKTNSRKTEIDLSQQPKGIYIIKVTTAKGVAVGKVVKE